MKKRIFSPGTKLCSISHLKPITSYGTATPNFPSITITNTQARVVRSLVKVGKKVAGNELRSATSRISTAATL
ncbi:hypothetical protein M0813_13462 [Anaeramoeba flamelloides]|uniref:Uncharacterized protein n=1 Tax=Anaeramoeba flamelloides TaxID=1746091 RepID=A0ABQ8Z8S3_9EUKA|nr:hypothetical protein M0813_13462 [Anaeramoeba flamelloides]